MAVRIRIDLLVCCMVPLLVVRLLVWPAVALAAELRSAAPTEESKYAQDAPEPGVWQVQPDSAAAQAKMPVDLDKAPPIPFRDHPIYSSSPHSAVVGFVPPGKDSGRVEFCDLRQMKRIGGTVRLSGKLGDYTHMVVSPDGSYLAGVVKAGGSTVEVWSTATEKSLHRFKVDENPKMKAGMVDFAGKDRLLTMKHKGLFPLPEDEATYQVWDLTSGAELVHFTYPLVYHRKWGAISPGGKYLAMEQTVEGYHILFWDLTTGKLAGQFEFQGKKDAWGQAAGMSFTPDGAKLAMLWVLSKKPDTWGRLLSWDVSTGRKLHDYRIGYELPSNASLWSVGGTKCLQWLPDSSGWLLFCHLLVDAESGAVVARIPPEPKWEGDVINRRLLGHDFVTSLKKKQFTVEPLPRTVIDAAILKARSKTKPPSN
jgi:hypothetical protein